MFEVGGGRQGAVLASARRHDLVPHSRRAVTYPFFNGDDGRCHRTNLVDIRP